MKNFKKLNRIELKAISGGNTVSCVCNYGMTVTVNIRSVYTADIMAAAASACANAGGVNRCSTNN